jgi:hypothetical protein
VNKLDHERGVPEYHGESLGTGGNDRRSLMSFDFIYPALSRALAYQPKDEFQRFVVCVRNLVDGYVPGEIHLDLGGMFGRFDFVCR